MTADMMAEIQQLYAARAAAQRTLFCRPERAEELRAAVEARGLADVLTVLGSPFVPEGTVVLAKPLPEPSWP